jgi:hypothetical protein
MIVRQALNRTFLFLTLLVIVFPTYSSSQTGNRSVVSSGPAATPFSAVGAQARRDQLAKIPELIGDPDPNARMANLETILNTHDSIMVQTALRLAFRSDDANLRALAMRAYIETVKEVTFEIAPPSQWTQQYEAIRDDQRSKDQFFNTHPGMRSAEHASFRFHLSFNAYNRLQSSGEAEVSGNGSSLYNYRRPSVIQNKTARF